MPIVVFCLYPVTSDHHHLCDSRCTYCLSCFWTCMRVGGCWGEGGGAQYKVIRDFSFSDLVVSNWHTGLRKRSVFEKEENGWVLCGACLVLYFNRISWLCPVESGENTRHSPHCRCLQPNGLVLLCESTFFAYRRWEPGIQMTRSLLGELTLSSSFVEIQYCILFKNSLFGEKIIPKVFAKATAYLS